MKIFKLLVIGSLLFTYLGTMAQSESSVMQTGKKYYIQSAMNYNKNNGGYWDIPGNPQTVSVGTSLNIWDLDGGIDRMFTIVESDVEGFYEMYVGNQSNTRVGTEGMWSENGTKIMIKEKSGHASVKFYFIHKGNGRFKIYSWDSKPICLDNRKNANGTGLLIWDDHDGDWVDWYLIDATTKKVFIPAEVQPLNNLKLIGDEIPLGQNFYIQSAMSYGRNDYGFWDLPGNKGVTIGDKIQIWSLDAGTDRLFRFEKKRYGEYLQIYCGNTSDGVVDIQDAKTDNGTKAGIWTRNHGVAQDFYLKHLGNGRYKIYHKSGKILCIAGITNENGTAVHLWEDHNGNHLEWYLVDPKTRKAYIPEGSTSAQPDFFIKNKVFSFSEETLVSNSKGTATVVGITGDRISLTIKGNRHCDDVPAGEPVDKAFESTILIQYKDGNYLYELDANNKGNFSNDGKTLSFSFLNSGVSFTVASNTNTPSVISAETTGGLSPLATYIQSGQGGPLTDYMERISLAQLKADNQGDVITKEMNALNADDQINLCMSMMNGIVKNKDFSMRVFAYDELAKINYKKASFLLKTLTNKYFTDFKEPSPKLVPRVNAIQDKIKSAK